MEADSLSEKDENEFINTVLGLMTESYSGSSISSVKNAAKYELFDEDKSDKCIQQILGTRLVSGLLHSMFFFGTTIYIII